MYYPDRLDTVKVLHAWWPGSSSNYEDGRPWRNSWSKLGRVCFSLVNKSDFVF